MDKPLFVLDSSLPYLEGLVEQVAEVRRYAHGEFTPEHIRGARALLIRSVVHADRHLLEGSDVEFVATATAGFDHIDTDYCRTAGIGWENASGCNAGGVVQYVLSSLVRWSLVRGVSLQGKTIGIVGVGNVGGRLAQRVGALGLRPLLCDPPRAEREGAGGFVSLETILQESDIITLHVPLTRTGKYATAGMVDEAFLSRCVRRPLLINACRGPVSPSDVLMQGLERGQISDLILDCWEGEPVIHSELLRRCFIATPHIAGWTADGKWRGSQMALEATCRALDLPLPEGLWDEAVLYTPDAPTIDLGRFPEEERILRAQLHTCDLKATTQTLQAVPEAFEQVRRAYRFPREASAYTIIGAYPEEKPLLEQLGFTHIG